MSEKWSYHDTCLKIQVNLKECNNSFGCTNSLRHMCQTVCESNNSINTSSMIMICMECNIKLNPKPTDGRDNVNEPEYKNDQSLSKHSSVVDMTINQSYDESTCIMLQ